MSDERDAWRAEGQRGGGAEPDGDPPVTGLAVRVLFVQVITLLLLWLLQARYGAG